MRVDFEEVRYLMHYTRGIGNQIFEQNNQHT